MYITYAFGVSVGSQNTIRPFIFTCQSWLLHQSNLCNIHI